MKRTLNVEEIRANMEKCLNCSNCCGCSQQQESCISKNQKTLRSLDLTTICPKILLGSECDYCYVKVARENGFNAKKLHYRIRYQNEILRWNKATIEKLNRMGGLRVFSFADYFEWMDEDLRKIIEDAKRKGLKLKAITKQVAFVEKFANDFDIIHVSIDNIGCGIDWNEALALRAKYKSVVIRSVVLKDKDIPDLAKISDIMTLNHGQNQFHSYTNAEKKELAKVYGDKLCCQTGKCESCTVKCGMTVVDNK